MTLFYLLIAILPLSDHHLIGKSFGGITFFKALGISCFTYAAFHLISRRSTANLFGTWQARLSVLFLVNAVVSFFVFREGQSLDYSVVWSCGSFLAFFVTVVSLVDSARKLRLTLLWTVGSVAVASLYVVKEWWEFHALYGTAFRPGGAAGDANYYAMSALMGLIIAYYLVVENRSLWERLFALGSVCITLAGLSLAASRGGFVGMVAAFLYIVLRSRRRVRNTIIAIALILPFSVFLPFSPVNRFRNPTYGDRVGAEQRMIVWKAGWKIIKQHPVLGIGAGRFKPEVAQYEEPGELVTGLAHNTYIELAAEMGIPVVLLFVSIIACTFGSLERVRRLAAVNGPRLLHYSATALQASLFGYAVCLCFLSGQYQKHLWYMVFLSIAFVQLAIARARKMGSRPRGEERVAAVLSNDQAA